MVDPTLQAPARASGKQDSARVWGLGGSPGTDVSLILGLGSALGDAGLSQNASRTKRR